MAKRRRLTPPQEAYLSGPAPEVKSLAGPFAVPGAPSPAPIARVAGEAASTAALRELGAEIQAAREEGRMIQRIPLDAIEADHLVRDRLVLDEAEMEVLRESLRARGQQVPVELVALGNGTGEGARYGLISGWRRLTALRALHAETGEPRFDTVLALIRRPESAADAYLAMVEENEIRVGIGHYERARIAAKAAELGIFSDTATAVRHLFAAASRAKRSKINSFAVLHDRLGTALRFPAAIPERLGLALVQAIDADPDFAPRLARRLEASPPESPEAEATLLTRALAATTRTPDVSRAKHSPGASSPSPDVSHTKHPTLARPEDAEEIAPGVYLQTTGGALRPHYTLSGPKVDTGFRDKLEAWLKG